MILWYETPLLEYIWTKYIPEKMSFKSIWKLFKSLTLALFTNLPCKSYTSYLLTVTTDVFTNSLSEVGLG